MSAPLEPRDERPEGSAGPAVTSSASLADGEWHRLHPATPLLRGGIAFVAVVGFLLANLRERIVELVLGSPDGPTDPLDAAYQNGQLGWAGLIVAAALVAGVVLFFFNWRVHTFRVGDDVVEVRSGILFRTHRRAPLDRIQGVAIARPLFARLFGAAKLDVSVAGQDAKVQLAYLRSADADRLRVDVLALASGARAAESRQGAGPAETASPEATALSPSPSSVEAAPLAPEPSVAPRGVLETRMREFMAPELDPSTAPPESVVRIPPGRLAGSLLLSGRTLVGLALVAVIVWLVTTDRLGFAVFVVLPMLLASVGYVYNRFTRSLRYSIAGTTDGVRIGYGLLSTSNDTLPPGRIHAIEVHQPLLWRLAGWWAIRIDRAGAAGEGSAQASTTMLPVGTAGDATRVLSLLLPGLAAEETRRILDAGLDDPRAGGFVTAPPRARWVRPLAWRTTGFAETTDAVVLRTGFLWRRLVVVPLARVQSVRIEQGPWRRMLGLVGLDVQTVAGPVHAQLPAAERAVGEAAFARWSAAAVAAAAADRTHRWRAFPGPVPEDGSLPGSGTGAVAPGAGSAVDAPRSAGSWAATAGPLRPAPPTTGAVPAAPDPREAPPSPAAHPTPGEAAAPGDAGGHPQPGVQERMEP
ncbi:PH domain-containing protein [Cnuibacter physcomitrellae]|uniref:PH domain-containing protein n=1 Tax=Cnuibacter physcomitrellae TaxID=1619308 RepID=UPI002175BA83|nr:PH domain-containing protein [Cnuibacter physcomitrellae]MCS5498977.1 PH domain-containing protein [Cnuibacter physcomitrellae]